MPGETAPLGSCPGAADVRRNSGAVVAGSPGTTVWIRRIKNSLACSLSRAKIRKLRPARKDAFSPRIVPMKPCSAGIGFSRFSKMPSAGIRQFSWICAFSPSSSFEFKEASAWCSAEALFLESRARRAKARCASGMKLLRKAASLNSQASASLRTCSQASAARRCHQAGQSRVSKFLKILFAPSKSWRSNRNLVRRMVICFLHESLG